MSDGRLHLPSPAESKVTETKFAIREAIESDPLSFITQVYEACVATTLNSIRTSGEYFHFICSEATLYKIRIKYVDIEYIIEYFHHKCIDAS